MTNERRGGRRPPSRPGGGGGHGEFRPYRPRPAYGTPSEEGAPRDFTPRQGPSQGRGGYAPRPAGRPAGFSPRPASDEGGMAIRVDPRRLGLLKELAAAEGLRPGQLVQRWIEERLDAERSGEPATPARGAGIAAERVQALETSLASLSIRVDQLVARLADVESAARSMVSPPAPVAEAPTAPPEPEAAQAGAVIVTPRRRGRPRKHPIAEAAPPTASGRVALHDEIIAVIRDRGPATASELATAILERGQYRPPRSAKPLDAATVNSRVSNPIYRARFKRSGRKIGLAE